MKKIFSYFGLCSCLLFFLTACTTTSTSNQVVSSETATSADQTNPTAANYNVQLGVNYLQQGDVQRAKRKLLLAMDQAPDSPQAQDAMGYYLSSTGDTSSAEKFYLKAIQLNPQAGSTHNNYGTYLCSIKRYQDADKQFMLAVKDPKYINTAGAYENAGLCALQIPDYPKAASYFEKAILQDPHRDNSYLQLSQINFKQNNYAKAQQYLVQYMQLNNDPSAEALWLGVRLARIANDNETAGRYAMMLQTKYPTSTESKQLRASQASLKNKKPDATIKFGF